jgi:shikimate dehydrogenase
VLSELNIPYLVAVRTPSPDAILYQDIDAELLAAYHLLINTTPLGTFPNISSSPPIPYEMLSPKHLAYDLVYNPEETLFLASAKAQGATIKNGSEMLNLQAERSWYIWNH